MPSPSPTSLHARCLLAVRTLIQTLDVEGITTDLIAVRKLPIHVNELIPGISICPIAETIEQDENCTDLIGYGCQLFHVMPSNQDNETFEDINDWLEARELMLDIILPLDEEPLPGVPEIHTCRVELGPIYDPTAFKNQVDMQTLVVRCFTKKVRRSLT